MSFFQRVLKGLSKLGEQFTVNGHTYRGAFKALDSGTMHTYLDDVEVMGVVRPGLLLIAQADAIINPSDTITRDGRTYTVLKTAQQRIAGAAVAKLVILA